MLTPDYQEFANRGRKRYPWQYRDLRHSHGEKLTKSTERCATATQQNRHESGTFGLCGCTGTLLSAKFTDSTTVKVNAVCLYPW